MALKTFWLNLQAYIYQKVQKIEMILVTLELAAHLQQLVSLLAS